MFVNDLHLGTSRNGDGLLVGFPPAMNHPTIIKNLALVGEVRMWDDDSDAADDFDAAVGADDDDDDDDDSDDDDAAVGADEWWRWRRRSGRRRDFGP